MNPATDHTAATKGLPWRAWAVVIALMALSACTQGGGTPAFLESPADETAPSADGAINAALASQSGEERLIYHVGPVDIPAGHKADFTRPLNFNFFLSKPMWVIGFEPRMVDANGEEVDSRLLHNAIISNQHEENPLCTSANVGNPFMVATSTLTPIRFPNGYGYPILASDPLEARVVVQNKTDTSYINVYFELTLIAKPMNEFVSMKDIKPMLFDVDACNHNPISIEPNSIDRAQATYTVPASYKLMVAHGVLQSYGICVDLTANKEVLPFWTAEAVFDEGSNILDLRNDPFENPSGIPFKGGDSLTLSVVYDNTSDGWLENATAAAMVYFAPKDE